VNNCTTSSHHLREMDFRFRDSERLEIGGWGGGGFHCQKKGTKKKGLNFKVF